MATKVWLRVTKALLNRASVIRCPYISRSYTTSTDDSSSQDTIVIDTFGKLYSIGINRPEKRNCLNSATVKHLLDALKQFEIDDAAYAAVLYGKGGNFSAGYDLEELASIDVSEVEDLKYSPLGLPRALCAKPVIAAISGYAVAGGLELALMCDLRVIEETAIVGVFSRRYGIPIIDGGTIRLPKLIGLSRAMDMVLTGRAVSGKEAFDWGLANQLVSCGTGNAIALATSLVKFPQKCLRADRDSVYYSIYAKSMEEAFENEFNQGKKVIGEESIKGAIKFMSGVGRHGKFDIDDIPKK